MIRLSLNVIICLFLILVSPFCANATNWYVDSAASGSNNGATWTNAWESFSDIVWGVGGIVAGDTLYISGGSTSKTYTSTLTVGASGTAESPISIKVGQDSGHIGRVIFDFDSYGDSAPNISGISLGTYDFITVNGSYNGAHNLTIKNLRNTTTSGNGSGIAGGFGEGISINYVEILNTNNCINYTQPTDIEVSYSNFQARGDAAVRLVSSVKNGFDVHKIHHNQIEILTNTVTGSGPDGIVCGNSCSMYDNTIEVVRTTEATSAQHSDMFVLDGDYFKVYNNETINVGDSVVHMTRWSDPSTEYIYIYNNLFRIETTMDTYPEFIRHYSDTSSMVDVKIMNNTFIDNSSDAQTIPIQFSYGTLNPTGTGLEYKNNIHINLGDRNAIISVAESTGFTSGSWEFANNVYYNDEAITGAVSIFYRGVSYTMSEWVSAGIETNPSLSQPTFDSYEYQSPSNRLGLPESDTVAKDQGEDLSSYFTTDILGRQRPSGSAWDIGAFEGSIGQRYAVRSVTNE